MLEGARQSVSTHTTKLHHQDFSKWLVPEAGPRGWKLKYYCMAPEWAVTTPKQFTNAGTCLQGKQRCS